MITYDTMSGPNSGFDVDQTFPVFNSRMKFGGLPVSCLGFFCLSSVVQLVFLCKTGAS